MPTPRRPKDIPAKLAQRMKRRWRVFLLRAKGDGTVEAHDAESAAALRNVSTVTKLA
jgi:hypothetical protein